MTYLPRFSIRSRRGAETFAWTSCVAAPFGLAELERRQAVAVEGDVDVGRVGVQALADHQARLAVRVGRPRRRRRRRPRATRSPDAFFQA